MEKKREQDLSVLEVLRLHREFHLPHPVPADEQEKPLDKVKEPPAPAAAGSVRSDDKETPPSDPSSCDGVGGGAGPDSRTYGGGWHP